MIERLQFHFSLSCIGEGNGNPLKCSCLENTRDGGAWWAAISGVAQSRTWLKRLSSNNKGDFCLLFLLLLCVCVCVCVCVWEWVFVSYLAQSLDWKERSYIYCSLLKTSKCCLQMESKQIGLFFWVICTSAKIVNYFVFFCNFLSRNFCSSGFF